MMGIVDTPLYRPRRTRRFRPRLLHALIGFFFAWSAIETYCFSNYFARIDSTTQDHAIPPSARIYIASIHWNDEEVLRSHWNNAILDLVRALGPDRVFLSIYESGSYDNTKDAIRELDADLEQLGVPRKVVLSNVTHDDDLQVPDTDKGEGWIDTAEGERELRRIPYLARLRNQSLQPLEELVRDGVVFDSVLFLNDVVFTPEDVLELLNTNGGDYAAACSLDFSSPPSYYDTFALRDSQGNGHATHSWPYFRSSTSRRAMKVLAPVPVSSCWNGMVAMPALPFYENLRFRGISDSLAQSHLEASECCLIHADNPLALHRDVFLNPRVRVGYHGSAYSAVHPGTRWLSPWQIFTGLWANRLLRWTTTDAFKEWMVRSRVQGWESDSRENLEPGEFCLINEMHVLKPWGWAHV